MNPPPEDEPALRQPMFNAPAVVLAIPVLILSIYGLQTLFGPYEQYRLVEEYALNPLLFRQGDWLPLFTHQFLHGTLMHVLINSVFCVAFAAPLARVQPTWAFIGFFLLCGAIAGAAFCAVFAYDNIRLLGASGAISGLMAASIRIRPEGGLYPLWDKRVLTISAAFIGLNVLIEFIGSVPHAENVTVAWQAHVFGYLAGMLLIGGWLRLFSPSFMRR